MIGDSWVFGDDHVLNNTLCQDDESTVASLNAQRAAHRMAAASGSAQEFEQEVQESELVGKEPKSAGEEYYNENLLDKYN
jgi:hypothetical protein